MLVSEALNSILSDFSGLSSGETDLLNRAGHLQDVKKGVMLVERGAICSQVFFVVRGRIRVFRSLPDGREITLYRVGDGEMCLFSMSCILDHTPLDAMAQVEIDTQVAVIPEGVFLSLISSNRDFQALIFKRLLTALSEVMLVLEEVTFHSMNKRVANYLLLRLAQLKYQAVRKPLIKITHEEIALELGTAREVVSRLLKEFEKQNILQLSRGAVLVLELGSLRKIAAM